MAAKTPLRTGKAIRRTHSHPGRQPVMARNPQFHRRAKHIDIKHHFVRERVSDGSIELKYCPTNEMVADILTKGLAHQQFSFLREKAGIVAQKLGAEP